LPKSTDPPFKLLFLDIETSPLLIYAWRTYETNAIAVANDWHLLSFAAKWHHEKTTHVYALPDFPAFKKDPESDKALCKPLWDLINEADAICAHNGERFDLPKINARLFIHGMPPPSPVKVIDTLKIARRNFGFTSNKLDDLCKLLGIGKKMKTGGFQLWLDCLKGDEKAWQTMRSYNKHDVVILEELYEKLKGWDNGHPNVNLSAPKDHQCPSCGSTNVQRRGYEMLKSFKAQRYQCRNAGCGRWSRGKREKIPTLLLN
jgi:hypothetical protein